jgi:hypothetical protein
MRVTCGSDTGLTPITSIWQGVDKCLFGHNDFNNTAIFDLCVVTHAVYVPDPVNDNMVLLPLVLTPT